MIKVSALASLAALLATVCQDSAFSQLPSASPSPPPLPPGQSDWVSELLPYGYDTAGNVIYHAAAITRYVGNSTNQTHVPPALITPEITNSYQNPKPVILLGHPSFSYSPFGWSGLRPEPLSIYNAPTYTSKPTNLIIPHTVAEISGGALQAEMSLRNVEFQVRVVHPQDQITSQFDGISVSSAPAGILLEALARYYLLLFPTTSSGGFETGVQVIGDNAFAGTGITNITLPDTVRILGSRAFAHCSGLTNATISARVVAAGINTQNSFGGGRNYPMNSSQNVFYNCFRLTDVTFSPGATRVPSSLISYLPSLTNVVITEGMLAIDTAALRECSGLTHFPLPNSLTTIGDFAFQHCTSLQDFVVPENVSNIGVGALAHCSNLADIVVDAANTHYEGSDGVLHTKLRTDLIQYPAGRQGESVNGVPGGSVCHDQASSYTVSNSVTNIFAWAFAGSHGLTEVRVPDTVVSIGDSAFADCTNLVSIRLPLRFWTEYARLGLSGSVKLLNVTLEEANLNRSHGQNSVISNPAAFSLFTQAEFNSNRTAGQSDVISNPMSYGLYTSDSIMDLRMGGLMIQRQGANAVVAFQPQTTTDLTQPFTNNGTPITNTIPMPGNKGFLRIQAKPEQSVP